MSVKFLDPYKDDPYGKLRGEKQDTYFKVAFDEAKVHPIDNGYMLAAWVTNYSGIVRSFKPEQPLEAGLCIIPIYNSEYETRLKVLNFWTNVKHQPSLYEKNLCDLIKSNETSWVGEGIVIKGEITFMPDDMLFNQPDTFQKQLVQQNTKVELGVLSGKLPAYTPPSNNAQRKSSGYSKGASLDEKLVFVKKEFIAFLDDGISSESDSLGILTLKIKEATGEDEAFLTLYFDMLMAVVRG
jgi:hypothetical protein